ncbi:MAG TPA: ABC transporter permease [Rhizobiaceae bacterium]|nr:ABC transporter permease [Rhizobiaceae bacterium]
MALGWYILRRLGSIIPTLILVSVIVFALQQLIPGDPAVAIAGDELNEQAIQEIRTKYGFDQPIYVQYFKWIGNVTTGDFGESYRNKVEVADLILQKLPVTIQLATFAMIVALVVGIPAGILAATCKQNAVGTAANILALSGISIPHFWLGIMMILIFSVNLGILPASGYVPPWEDLRQNIVSLIMPSIVLGTGVAGVITRHTRGAMLQVLSSDYVRTARAKGLAERVVVSKHALKNALIPVITLSTIEFGQLLSGAILTEQIFSIPGFGKLIVDSVFNREYAVVQGVVLVTATIFILLNFLADILYFVVNPRMRSAHG